MVQPQNFNVITTHTINGDVIFVQNQFAGARNPSSPAHAHRSCAVFAKYRLDLLDGGEFTGIGFLKALVSVTDLPTLTLHVAGQRINR